MAGDWIKMRSDLGTDPTVIRVAMATGLDTFAVVGRLHALWAWADAHTANGAVPGVTLSWIDAHLSHAGFADALVQAGWLTADGAGFRIPKFDRHMGQAAKKRAAEAERKRSYRKRGVSRPCPEPVPQFVPPKTGQCPAETGTREEKRREEKRREDGPPNPPRGGGPESAGPPAGFDPLRAAEAARKAFEARWAAAGLRKFSRLSPSLQARLQALLRDGWWAEHYPAALARAGATPFLAAGLNRQAGPMDVEFFLRDDTVRKIVDGVYDANPGAAGGGKPVGKESAREMVDRLRAAKNQGAA